MLCYAIYSFVDIDYYLACLVAIRILCNKEYTVGRKNCDFLLPNDASISRKHASLKVNFDECNLVSPLVANRHPMVTVISYAKNNLKDRFFLHSTLWCVCVLSHANSFMQFCLFFFFCAVNSHFMVIVGCISQSTASSDWSLQVWNIDQWEENVWRVC